MLLWQRAGLERGAGGQTPALKNQAGKTVWILRQDHLNENLR